MECTIDLSDIVNKILSEFNKSPKDIAKKKHGSIKEYTCYDVVTRLLKYKGRVSIEKVFPEIKSRVTINKVLVGAFGIKPIKEKTWLVYILEKANLKYCNLCQNILDLSNFYVNNTKVSYSPICKVCDLQIGKEYRENNREKEKERSHSYYKRHIGEAAARNSYRKGRIKIATPSWANLDRIKELYSSRPEGMHVDHIIPLKGALVCGLHVENNLQYLLASENISKGNKYTP